MKRSDKARLSVIANQSNFRNITKLQNSYNIEIMEDKKTIEEFRSKYHSKEDIRRIISNMDKDIEKAELDDKQDM